MEFDEARKEIQRLTKEIEEYNRAFFQESRSLVSDYHYDQLLKRLEALEQENPHLRRPDSPTQKIGEAPSKHFPTRVHPHPMYSLSNTYETNQIRHFQERLQRLLPNEKIDFLCELKLDGIAVSLTYRKGIFQALVSRGDGIRGDDLTQNHRLIQSIPQKLQNPAPPEEIYIRGEVFMSHQKFHKLNAHYQAQGRDPLVNTRNGTAGLLRTKEIEPALFEDPPLTLGTYGAAAENLPWKTQGQFLDQAEAWGFHVPPTRQYCPTHADIILYLQKWEKKRTHLPMDTDGVVIKVNNLAHHPSLGHTAKSPRWAIAYKYKPLSVETILEDIVYQVGRTGVIVPVAQLRPVQLAGSLVRRATLHNAAEMKRLDLHAKDTVSLEKGGDIIPKVTGVHRQKRVPHATPHRFTPTCPACATPLVEVGAIHHYCPNRQGCPPQLKNSFLHFIQRTALDLTSIGPRTIERLLERGLIRRPADLYRLTPQDLMHLEGFQEKSVQNFLQALERTKKIPFARVLFGLGIRHVGAVVAEKLARHFHSIDRLADASREELLALREVGPMIATSLIDYFAAPENRTHIAQLRKAGLILEEERPPHAVPAHLAGKKFVVTGIFPGYARDDIYAYIQDRGGQVVGSLSKKTDFLVVGKSPGPTKVARAQRLSVPPITYQDLRHMEKKA